MITKNIVCGQSPTTISAPTILASKESLDFYEMFYQQNTYEIDNFSNSNAACPITSISIDETAIDGKNTISSEGTSIQITSLISDTKLKISIPDTNTMVEKY